MSALSYLLAYKTEKCDQVHSDAEFGNWGCNKYHSDEDKRRPVIKQNTLQYANVLLKSNASACQNIIEYFYHPLIYKTKPCKIDAAWAVWPNRTVTCKQNDCPFLHQGESVEYLHAIRRMHFHLQVAPDPFIQKINCIINKPNEQNYMEDIKRNLLQSVQKQIVLRSKQRKNKQNQSIQVLNAYNPNKQNKKIKEKYVQKVQRVQQQPITYPQLQYYQSLTLHENLGIVEDCHHQYKHHKDILSREQIAMVMKYISSFLNSEGGVLYLGVDDKLVVRGVNITQQQFDKFLVSVDAEGRHRMNPPLMPQKYSIRAIPVYKNRVARTVVVEVRVPKGRELHVYNKECYLRLRGSTHCLDPTGIIELIKNRQRSPLQCIADIHRAFDSGCNLTYDQLVYLKAEINRALSRMEYTLAYKS